MNTIIWIVQCPSCVKFAILVGSKEIFPDLRKHLPHFQYVVEKKANKTNSVFEEPQALIQSVIDSNAARTIDEFDSASAV